MNITCSIQKVDYYIDQFDDLGVVDLQDALNLFQAFPFEEELKKYDDNEFKTCYPSLTFKNTQQRTLKIWAESYKGFFAMYSDTKYQYKNFISNSVLVNNSIAPEDYIEAFFNGRIMDIYSDANREEITQNEAPDKIETNEQIQTFVFDNDWHIEMCIESLLWMAGSLLIFAALSKTDLQTAAIMGIVTSLIWLPGIILHLSYRIKNNDARVEFNTKDKTLTYTQGNNVVKFKREDIYNCEINKESPYSRRQMYKGYTYLWIVLNDKRQVVITNFITEPETIIHLLKAKYKVALRGVPFLPL